jgi:hypothetical protein
MTEAAGTCKTSVNFSQTTQCNNPEDRHLHTCCHVNLQSYYLYLLLTKRVKLREAIFLWNEECYIMRNFLNYSHLQQYNTLSYDPVTKGKHKAQARKKL